MSENPKPAPTASTVGPCPTTVQISRTPGTGRLPSSIASPDYLGSRLLMDHALTLNLFMDRSTLNCHAF